MTKSTTYEEKLNPFSDLGITGTNQNGLILSSLGGGLTVVRKCGGNYANHHDGLVNFLKLNKKGGEISI